MTSKIISVILCLAVILTVMLVPGAAPVKVALAQSHIGVNVTPQQTTVGFNENFNVTIWIDDSLGESYDGVAIRLVYNTSYVTATGVTDAGTFDWVLDPGTINNTWNATHGLITYDAISLIAGPLNTSNPVCTINFTSNSSNTGIAGLDFIYIPADAATSVTSVGVDILNWTYVVNGTVRAGIPALTVNVTPSGGGNVTVNGTTPPSYPNTTNWSWGDNVTLNATAATGYSFVNWSGDLSGSTNPTSITMNGNYSITANFAAAAVYIGLNVTPQDTTVGFNENFNVTIWIDDSLGESYDGTAIRLVYNTNYVTATGVTDAGTFDFVLDPGTINNTWNATHGLVKYDAISLMAGPLNTSNPVCTINFTSNSSNTGISGLNFIYLPADAATSVTSVGVDILNWTYVVNGTVTVVSAATKYNLTINSTAGGSVTTPGEGTFTCNASEVVALVAVADTGYSFVNWTGDVSTIANVNSATTNITMSGNYSITANFAAAVTKYNLTITSTTGGSVTTPGEGTFTCNASEVVALVAVADTGYSFVNWTGDVSTVVDVNSATTNITMNGNYSITANFAAAAVYIGLNVTPQDTTVGFNENFNVTIWIDDPTGQSYDGTAIRLVYNTNYVTATGVTDAGTFDWVLDPGTINNTWNATHGLVKYDAISLMAGPLNTSNPVCTINFTSNSSNTGISGLDFIYIPADAATSITLVGVDILNWTYVVNGTVTIVPAQYNLTINSTAGGNVTTPGEGTFTYNASEVVALVATADTGYSFVNWTGDVSTIANVNSATTNITMNGNYSITANFAAALYIGLNVTPQDTTVGFNENFNVTIWIDNPAGESYDGTAIRLVYNTNYVTATSVTDAGTFDWVLDPGTINNTWNATHGLVKYDAVNLGGPLNISNPVCTINFTSNSSNTGISGLDFIYIPADAATCITLVGVDILNWTYVVNGTVTVAVPDISVSPTEKNFGNITVGSSLPQTFNVSNVGSADLVVGAINITGTNADQFTIQNDNVSNQTIIAGGSATLQVVFTPTSTGAKSATLNIPSNDPDEATVLVPLSGTGVTGEPDISVSPTEKNFGNINVGSSSSAQTFNVSNVGDADLVVWTINITGTHANQFTIHNDNVTNQTIIANGSATLQVVFSPTSTGAKSATLNIPSNDPYEPTVSVPLSGTGVTGGGGGGGGGGGALYYLTVNMLGDISDWEISEQGNLLEPLQVSSADNKVTIALSKDASCLDKGNTRLSSITISRKSGLPSLPEDYSIIGPAYEFRPAGAKFAPSLSLTLGYADNDVPQYVSEGDIYIAYYDATAENWVPLNSQVNTQNNRVAAPVSHFTTFAIIGIAVPPTPAEFSVTSLDLSSEQVEPGQEVLVTVNVTNTGGSEGSYTLDLTINGEVEQTKTVTLAASASDTVTFIVIKEELGTYTVSVDGLTKEFIVGAPSWVSQYWWIVLAAIVIIGVVVSFLWARRRRVS